MDLSISSCSAFHRLKCRTPYRVRGFKTHLFLSNSIVTGSHPLPRKESCKGTSFLARENRRVVGALFCTVPTYPSFLLTVRQIRHISISFSYKTGQSPPIPPRTLHLILFHFTSAAPSPLHHIRHISIWCTTTPSEPSPYPFLDAPVTGVNALKFACGTLYDTGSSGRFSAAVCPFYFLVTGFIYLHSFYVKF